MLVEVELLFSPIDPTAGDAARRMAGAELPGLTGWFLLSKIRQSATSVAKEGWRYKSFEPVNITRVEDWSLYGAKSRTWGFNVHTLAFLEPLLREYDETGNGEWLRMALNVAMDWISRHPDSDDESDPMAWYDMALALRTPHLLALAMRVANVPELSDETVVLAAELARHLDELRRERAFNPSNNHGFYTAAAQLHMARFAPWLSGAESAQSQGVERMRTMASNQFSPDGVHLEHSPDYHRMLLSSFERAVEDGLITDEDTMQRVSRAATVLGWMVQPDGNLVQFGDSPETRMTIRTATSIDPETLFILKDGTAGAPPSEEMKVFSDGGYAFVRSPQPSAPGELAQSGYLAFSAGYHSRAHKHADDLNVVWYDRGHQILTDAGRFGYGELLDRDSPLRAEGYYYAAPERQYVESTMAHNTLMMDGRNQQRPGRKPYGSALTECVQNGDRFDLSARVRHPDYVHRRRVVYSPGRELRLLDSLHSRSSEAREAVVWLNLDGDFELEFVGEEIVLVAETQSGPLRVSVSGPGRPLDPVRGQQEPLRGWRSRKDGTLEPTWSLGVAFRRETRASVANRLRLY